MKHTTAYDQAHGIYDETHDLRLGRKCAPY
jgi:hypothetical protein